MQESIREQIGCVVGIGSKVIGGIGFIDGTVNFALKDGIVQSIKKRSKTSITIYINKCKR